MLVEEGDVQKSMTINWYQQPLNLAAGSTCGRDVLGNVAPTPAAGAAPGSAAPVPLTTAVPEVAPSSLLLLVLVVAWERGGLFLTCKNDRIKGHMRKEG